MKNTALKSILAFSVITFLSVTNAFAHIGFGDDYECDSTYEKNCFLQFNSRRVARFYFRGTPAELGENCTG